jgi:mono/diheme cytochrome c family protein
MRRLLLLCLSLAAAGCSCGDTHSSDILQRMETQSKFLPYKSNTLFADERNMRIPPEGTVSRERPLGSRAFMKGLDGDQLVQNIPVPVTPELLGRGKKKFEIVCATCHGLVGNGDSMVADNMPTRLPPSLVALQDKPAGFFYQAITLGYGLMPSFSGEIPIEDRWAVVAYVRALQLSQNAKLSMLPAEDRQKVLEGKSWQQ